MLGIIPAAGKGTRFKELGVHYSKTVLPYKEKPILIWQIEWLERQGCDNIVVVVNHQEESIRAILDMYKKNVTIARQDEMNGLSGAIYNGTKGHSGPVLVQLGDIVVNEDIDKKMFSDYFVSAMDVSDYSRWCMVATDFNHDGKLMFIDKPTEKPNTTTALSGVYYFRDGALLEKLLEKQLSDEKNKISSEYQLSTVLGWIAKEYKMNVIDLNLTNFGTLEEYLKNRGVKNSRSFNDIEVIGNFVKKSSSKEREKLVKEYNWYKNLPDTIKMHTPRMFDADFFSDKTSYTMEKILGPSLKEMHLFLDNTPETWACIFDSTFALLDEMKQYGKENSFMESVVEKTVSRIAKIDFPIDAKTVDEFVGELKKQIYSKQFRMPSVMHGDFCFSNLMYVPSSSSVMMIDPRGELFGDHYYEVAKLCHSVLFDYEFIDAELYTISGDEYNVYTNGTEHIKCIFYNLLRERYSEDELNYIFLLTASLFLSMIPLHAHNKRNQHIYYFLFEGIYELYKNMKGSYDEIF